MIRDTRIVLPSFFVISWTKDRVLTAPTYQHPACHAYTVYYMTDFVSQASAKALGPSGSSLQTEKSAVLKPGADLLHSLEALASLL